AQGQDPDELRQKTKASIAAGVAFLKESQTVAGTWKFQGNDSPDNELVIGVSALCGLALLENQVLMNDSSVRKVHKLVKDAVNNDILKSNFSNCMALLFLNRLHREDMRVQGNVVKHADAKLVLKLAEKIVTAQGKDGLWDRNGMAGSDNTQLALMSLWTARRYANIATQKPLNEAIAACEKRLRSSQQINGGWSPHPSFFGIDMKPTGSMTCTGLLGIGLHLDVAKQNDPGEAIKIMNEDPAVSKARTFLVTTLKQNLSSKEDGPDRQRTYFLWTLERVATLYKWRKLDGVDWFDVGSRYLLAKQSRDGRWSLEMQAGEFVDTAYALLFLRKSNSLEMLSGPFVRDPVLKSKPVGHQNTATRAKEALAKLLAAPPDKQAEILEELQNTKGSEFTEALVEAIRKLETAKSKEAAREALARRFQRFTARVLTEYMQDNDRELRLAAVKAIRFKPDRDLKKHVILLQFDMDPTVATAALETLKALKE
ncbi:MAG TPA: hypothetical protein PLX97_04645, partial [Gemmatales bacterium]|nr:hypothetical protein [Gemmatales bacterium]